MIEMASVSKKIKMALAYEGMSEAELARRLGFSPAAFNQRMACLLYTSS